jgi:hypothetical protein
VAGPYTPHRVRVTQPGYLFFDQDTLMTTAGEQNFGYLPSLKSNIERNVELHAIDATGSLLQWLDSKPDVTKWKNYDELYVWKGGVWVLKLRLHKTESPSSCIEVKITSSE